MMLKLTSFFGDGDCAAAMYSEYMCCRVTIFCSGVIRSYSSCISCGVGILVCFGRGLLVVAGAGTGAGAGVGAGAGAEARAGVAVADADAVFEGAMTSYWCVYAFYECVVWL